MGDIGKLPPVYHILPGQPGARPGEGNKAPQRKPDADGEGKKDKRKSPKDDGSRIDEYA